MGYHNPSRLASWLICLALVNLTMLTSEAWGFETNLALGTEIDTGHGSVKITKISQAMKSPVKGRSTSAEGHMFVILETVVVSMTDTKLESIGFALVSEKGSQFGRPCAYGEVEVLGKIQNFETTDGAAAYAHHKGDALNLFFEVPKTIRLDKLKLVYDLARRDQTGKSGHAEVTPGKTFSVQIKTNDGKQIHLENVCRKTVMRAQYSRIRTDLPRRKEVISHNFYLDTGPISILIPFEIVNNLQIQKINNYHHARVLLGNGTTLEGGVWIILTGKGELGETKVSAKDIESIVFNHKALDKFEDAPFGAHSVTLNTVDGKKMKVSKASFVEVKANENGLWLADEPSDILDFKETNGTEHKVNWDKVREIRHKNPEVSLGKTYVFNVGTPFFITTKGGNSMLGSIQTWLVASNRIRGTALINNSYSLRVTIPLYKDSYKSIEFTDN